MFLPPPKPDPEDVIREVENDPLSQFVWSLAPSTRKFVRNLSDIIGRLLVKPSTNRKSQRQSENRVTSR
jgi:hypothetical protein